MQEMKNNDLGVVQCGGNFLKQHPALMAFFCLLQAVGVFGQTPDRLPDPNFHLYLLIGQSNMAGRGQIDKESGTTNPRVLMFTKELAWKPASDPLHFDKPFAGVGPGLAFGEQMAAANPRMESFCGVGPEEVHRVQSHGDSVIDQDRSCTSFWGPEMPRKEILVRRSRLGCGLLRSGSSSANRCARGQGSTEASDDDNGW